MSSDSDFVAHVLELLEGFGEVNAKRMFGGQGIFREGLMFALVADCELYFKVDDENRETFEAAGLTPFRYQRRGEEVSLSYYHCPEQAFRDRPTMRKWAELGWMAAVRRDEAKPKSKRKRQSP